MTVLLRRTAVEEVSVVSEEVNESQCFLKTKVTFTDLLSKRRKENRKYS